MMRLKEIEISGFKSFAKKSNLSFQSRVTCIVGPNGSGKSNVVEAIRFVLGEQSMKSLRGKGGSDLIFKGSKGVPSASRAYVAISFDNKDRVFSFNNEGSTIAVDFDEITISREVFSDGANTYKINNSEVRLKDIVELLASVHIGSTGHHIISQGEADRILSSNNKDRRQILEDALGLKIYQYRIKESERKLEKSEINIKEVGSLRRELSPHLTFLKKQVEKIEKAEELRRELSEKFDKYFSDESKELKRERGETSERIKNLNEDIKNANRITVDRAEPSVKKESEEEIEILSLRDQERSLESRKNDIAKNLGKLEGRLEAIRDSQKEKNEKTYPASFFFGIISKIKKVSQILQENGEKEEAISLLSQIIKEGEEFGGEDTSSVNSGIVSGLVVELEEEKKKLGALDIEVSDIRSKIRRLEQRLISKREEERESERKYYEEKEKLVRLEGEKSRLEEHLNSILIRETNLEEDRKSIQMIVGRSFDGTTSSQIEYDARIQETLKRDIERLKIRLEDSGGAGSGDVLKEYKETEERDAFLKREVEDLESSIKNLKALIKDLRDTLDNEFKKGVSEVNKSFNEFFQTMFGGGSAHLTITVEHGRGEDPEDAGAEYKFERGVEIGVSLPQKKVRELGMLSGGERSLVSIALLFAMSAVNPPPFLVLDETDAALDESNSRRYGDMLEKLSKHSQLIVVTHNRETMSRASSLYGVTIGLDGASKLLSLKFEEAKSYAK
mgnify:FL=1